MNIQGHPGFIPFWVPGKQEESVNNENQVDKIVVMEADKINPTEVEVNKTASEILDELYKKASLWEKAPGLSEKEMKEFKALGARIDRDERLTAQEYKRFEDLAEKSPTRVFKPAKKIKSWFNKNKTASEILDEMYEKIKK